MTDQPVLRYWLWLAVASSSVVFFEPSVSDILIAGLVVVAFAAGLRVPRRLSLGVLLIGVYLGATLMASIFAPDPSESVRPLLTRFYLACCWWLLIAALIVESPDRNSRIVWHAYLFAAAAAAIVGVLAAYDVVPYTDQFVEFGRVRSFFKDPNVFGPFLVPAAIYAVFRLENAQRYEFVLLVPLLIAFALGMLLSFSRGSWMNFAVSLLLYLILRTLSQRNRMQRRRTMLIVGAIALSSAVAVITILNYEPTRSTLEKRLALVQDYDVESQIGGKKGRFDVQLETLSLAMQNPMGIGAGQSGKKYFQWRDPHNVYLHILVEAGWIGGLAFYAFIVLTFWRSRRLLFERTRLRGELHVALSCLAGLLLQSMFIDSTHWRHFFLLLGIAWALTIIREQDVVDALSKHT